MDLIMYRRGLARKAREEKERRQEPIDDLNEMAHCQWKIVIRTAATSDTLNPWREEDAK